MSADRLTALHALAGMKRDAELAKVEHIVRLMGGLQADIGQLRAALAVRAADADLDAARLSGADLAWEGWAEARLRDLSGRLAGLRAAHETALGVARAAFGRADVLRQMAADARDRARARRQAR